MQFVSKRSDPSSVLNYEEVCISKVLAEVKTVEVWSMKCGSVAVRQYGSMRSDPAPWSAGCLPDCLIWTKPTGEHLEEEDLDKRYKKNINKILPEMSQPTEARQLDVDDLDKKHKKPAIIGILPEMGNTLMMMVMIMMTQKGICGSKGP